MYVPEGRSIPALSFLSAIIMAIGAYLPGEGALFVAFALVVGIFALAGMVNEAFYIERRRA